MTTIATTHRFPAHRPAPGPLSPEARGLAADPAHVALARRIARRRMAMVPHLRDEIEGAALLGLALAARDFDPARGWKFSTYAHRRILGAILDEQRTSGWFSRSPRGAPQPPPLSLSAVTTAKGEFGEGEIDFRHPPAGDLPVGWEAEYHDDLGRLARGLPGRRGEAVRLYFGDAGAATVRAVGRRMGLGEARAAQLVAEGIAMIRERCRRVPA